MQVTKATIRNLDTGRSFPCLFNPTEYTIAKSNSWQPKPVQGKNVPQLEFTGGSSRTLTLQLFFDTCEARTDVRNLVNQLVELTLINEGKKNPKTHRGRPPLCLFQWGGTWSFKAAITQLSIRYTLFQGDGTPVRATADVTFQEAEDATVQKGTNPTSHAEPGHKRREVRPLDTLALISFEEYGDPNQWRRIADANAIDDPLSLTPGQVLAIPPVS